MPHLKFRATSIEIVKTLSQILPPKLSNIINTDEGNFTFEQVPNKFYHYGEYSESFPIVEVEWFARSKEIQDLVAQTITSEVRHLTTAEDIVVVFKELLPTSYYENGNHF